tara:strand:- start:249 stop:2507 length:2259 start_codon:yes stop_codon:yes gene_type:complete
MAYEKKRKSKAMPDSYRAPTTRNRTDEPTKVDDSENDKMRKLKAAISSEINSSIGYTQDEIVQKRKELMDAYYGEPYGDEVQNRSQMVDRTVMDTIEQAMPSLMRIFSGAQYLVEFKPIMPDPDLSPSMEAYLKESKSRTEQAEQATEYCNYVFYQDNDGFVLTHDWIKDALMMKTGVVKMWWDETEEVRFETYTDLTEDELVDITENKFPDADVVEKSTRTEKETVQQQTGIGMDGLPVIEDFEVKIKLTTIKMRFKKKRNAIKIAGVPAEEFLISRQATSLYDSTTTFVAHRTLTPKSDLLKEGYDPDVVKRLPGGGRISNTDDSRRARFNDEKQDPQSNRDGPNAEVEVYECYIRYDYDGDGIAEIRRVVYVGEVILKNEEFGYIPFYDLCPIRIPHKFHGLGYADITEDLQRLKTALWRQMLDNLYGTNSPEIAIGPGVNVDDALNRTPRGVIRTDDVNQIRPIEIPFSAAASYPMLDYVDRQRKERTGITADAASLSPDEFKRVTATGVSEFMSMARSRPELTARVFAETGIRRLFVGMLELLREHQDFNRVVELRGGYVPINPSLWSADMFAKTSIGLGHGSEEEKRNNLMGVLSLQKEIEGGGEGQGMVTGENIYNTLVRMMPLSGLPDITPFFNYPEPKEEGPPRPSPEEQEMMGKLKLEEQKFAAELKLETEKAAKKLELETAIAQVKADNDIRKIDADAAAREREMNLKHEQRMAELEKEAALELVAIRQGHPSGQGQIPNE